MPLARTRSPEAETIIARLRRQRLLATTLAATKRLLGSCQPYPLLFNYLDTVEFSGQDVVTAVGEDSHLWRQVFVQAHVRCRHDRQHIPVPLGFCAATARLGSILSTLRLSCFALGALRCRLLHSCFVIEVGVAAGIRASWW